MEMTYAHMPYVYIKLILLQVLRKYNLLFEAFYRIADILTTYIGPINNSVLIMLVGIIGLCYKLD